MTAEDLKVAGAMAVLLRDALKPNLLQTLEGGAAFVHCGPFANIAHGNSSILADRLALATHEVVCTEAGFGADMGAEKFFDIKCRASGLVPDAAVVVATVRALKMHGGVGRIVAGKPLDPALLAENAEAVRAGAANLAAHIEIVRTYGVPVVVAINSFPTDTDAEVAAIREVALAAGARDAVVTTHFADGGRGAEELAAGDLGGRHLGRRRASTSSTPTICPLREKIEAIALRIYGANGVDELPAATKALSLYEELGFGKPAGLHGQDAVLAQPRPGAQGPAARLPGPDPRGPPCGRRRVRHAARGRDADDARAALASGRREHRHRRRRATWSGSSSPARRTGSASAIVACRRCRPGLADPAGHRRRPRAVARRPLRIRRGRLGLADVARTARARLERIARQVSPRPQEKPELGLAKLVGQDDAVGRVEDELERGEARTERRRAVPRRRDPGREPGLRAAGPALHLAADRAHRVEATGAACDLAQLAAELGAGEHLGIERDPCPRPPPPAAPRATVSGMSSRSSASRKRSAAALCGPNSPSVIGCGPGRARGSWRR